MKTAKLTKIDLRKELKHLHGPSAKQVEILDIPKMKFVMVDGTGDPNGAPYQQSINALYNIAYTLKFMVRKEQGIDYPVMALEGLWWTDTSEEFDLKNRERWNWTMMISVPKYASEQLFRRALEEIRRKKKDLTVEKARFEDFHEGLSAQIMHIGPYSSEMPTIEKLHKYIEENGYRLGGKHHEIYMGDPRRTKPERLKTILRQPIKKAP